MVKEGINSYKKAYETIEEGLKIKKTATSAQLLDWLITNYNINSLNITTKGITYYLKQQGYEKYKKYESKPWHFKSSKIEN